MIFVETRIESLQSDGTVWPYYSTKSTHLDIGLQLVVSGLITVHVCSGRCHHGVRGYDFPVFSELNTP